QEHYVASIKGRDWKQVHNAEHNRQQSSYAPEHFPTPMLRENVIDSLESSNTFISTCRRRKYRFQLTAISRKFFLAARDSNPKRLEKSVFLASDSIKSEALQVVCRQHRCKRNSQFRAIRYYQLHRNFLFITPNRRIYRFSAKRIQRSNYLICIFNLRSIKTANNIFRLNRVFVRRFRCSFHHHKR